MLKRILKSNQIINSILKCNITGKTNQPPCEKLQRPQPYPYHKKDYRFWNAVFDDTFKRMQENSKIIVVDGAPFAGKTKLAQELANEFDMCFMQSANMDMLYINDYGYDMRKLDPLLPESCRSLSWKNFWKKPQTLDTAALQIINYKLKYEQYVNALIHLFNTGQGVVVDGGSVFSDFVYMEAMHENGFVSDGAKSVYADFIRASIDELLKPHLVLYLNISTDEIYNRIKKDGQDYQKSSPLLESDYFKDINRLLKQEYLTTIGRHSELLIYDWTNFGDSEIVVEDIERMDFDRYQNKATYNPHETKFSDWRQLRTNWDWNYARIKYTHEKNELIHMNIARYDVPEFLIPPEDFRKKLEIWMNAPGMKYCYGFNPQKGDNVLFKW